MERCQQHRGGLDHYFAGLGPYRGLLLLAVQSDPMSSKSARHVQYAALPYRRRSGLSLEVLLVTSRETRRWVIPKGWPVEKLAPHESAALEAMEEAGLLGGISKRPIGCYGYRKRLSTGSIVSCQVTVFALEVKKQLPSWPEKNQRRTRWFKADVAAKAVKEPELRAILRNLNSLVSQ
jgi:8-oxo-dGTP pyrophosphatase MutT (NUDIX family)